MKKKAYVIWCYATLLLIGGIIGFVKAGSIASLVMATILAFLLVGTGYGVWQHSKTAYHATIGVLACILAFFGYRFLMHYHQKPTVAGVMTFITGVLIAYLLARKQAMEMDKVQ